MKACPFAFRGQASKAMHSSIITTSGNVLYTKRQFDFSEAGWHRKNISLCIPYPNPIAIFFPINRQFEF
jgi:hypothetical protein